jgi:hypothetical protein
MNQEELESRILQLWVTTRIPLTRANLQILTGVARKKLEPWLRALVVDGVLDVDVDDKGEMIYSVRGAERGTSGPTTVAEMSGAGAGGRGASRGSAPRGEADVEERLRQLGMEAAKAAGKAMVLKREAPPAGGLVRKRKSLVASGLLSFFFGPLGWLYAGHWKEAIPAGGAYLLAAVVLPKFLITALLGIVGPLSAAVGVAYAWKYNKDGERQKLLPPEEPGR